MPRALVVLAAALVPAGLAAQAAPAVTVGSRVRIIAPSVTTAAVIGTVVRLDSAAVAVARDHRGDTLTVDRAAIASIETSAFHTNRATLAAVVGGGAGFLTGLTLGLGAGDDPPGTPNGKTGFQKGLVWGGIGAAVGLVGGYLIGSSWLRDRWVPAALAPAEVGLIVAPGRGGVAIRVPF